MRAFLAITLFGCCALGIVRAQSGGADDRVLGTWTGSMHCEHGDGPLPDIFTLSITRDASGKIVAATDWGLSTSDGRKGPLLPFTTVTLNGSTILATATMDPDATQVGSRTARLAATIENGTITGTWRVANVDDMWWFSGKRQ